MSVSDIAASYDLVVIGGGPAGLAATSTAARAGLSTVLFDENPGLGGQIYRGIAANPVKNRAILGDDYWAGSALAAEVRGSGALIVRGARAPTTAWECQFSLGPSLLTHPRRAAKGLPCRASCVSSLVG